ncbi:MAG: glycosyltransferase family A protein [Actinomycetota bacterium]
MSTPRGNEWHLLDPAPIGSLEATMSVSVVIPTRGGGPRLERLLRSIANQTYPTDLLEIVVTDDASEPPLEFPATIGDVAITTVRCEDDGRFGAGKARNAGARSATGDIIVFLDADVLAGPTAIEAIARWFHVAPYAMVTGRLDFFDDEPLADRLDTAIGDGTLGSLLEGVASDDQHYRENTFRRTFDLTVDHPDLFRVVIGAVMGVSRAMHEEIGGLRELGIRGIEDIEYGYRLHTAGALLVLEREARLWHQGRRHFDSKRAAQTKIDRAPFMQDLMAAPTFREPPKSAPTVPTVMIDCCGLADPDPVIASVLATGDHDVVCLVDTTGSDDPRVRTRTQMSDVDLAAVPYRCRPMTDVRFERDAFSLIVEQMRDDMLGVVHVVDVDGEEILEVTSTRATGRARYAGASDDQVVAEAGRRFGAWWVPAADLGVTG